MPKTLIREFDNSKAGMTLSSNFAVFVPGYAGEPKLNNITDKDGTVRKETKDEVVKEALNAGIYYETDKIYKLSSQKDFIRYIGENSSGAVINPVAPVLERMFPEGTVLPAGGCDPIDFLHKQLSVADFKEYDKQNEYSFYFGEKLEDSHDERYGQNGYLFKTLDVEYTPSEEGGKSRFERETWVFTKATKDDLYMDLINGSNLTSHSLFKILTGNEGVSAKALSDQIGNKIAYELLGLGYTVYFRVLDATIEAVSQLQQEAFWEPLRNKSTYRIRYITSGGCYDKTVAERMVAIAEFNNKVTLEEADTLGKSTGRGDCIALLDIDESGLGDTSTQNKLVKAFGDAATALANKINHSKYAAIFAPRVVFVDDEFIYPCSFYYLACAAYAQERFAEWYAVAGYTRGICTKAIAYTTYIFGDIAINTLAPRISNSYTDTSINLILNERGNYYLWGNRTSAKLDADGLRFSHFLNIRQLCCTIKQVLYEATRRFTFDPNSDLLWINFVNTIRPTLENMKADQGINGYKISKVATDKKAVLVAKIRIVPIEAVEDFDISIYLEDSLSGIIVDADEEVAE